MRPLHHDGLELKEIYCAHFNDLYLYARAVTKSSDMAKDAISDVFLYLLNSKIDLNYVKDVRAYLFKSVKNSCLKMLSRNPVHMEYMQDDQDYEIAEEINPQQLMIGQELENFINQSISSLPDQARLVLEMIRFNHMTYEEVSIELGISVNTVRNHLVAATKTLRQQLDQYNDDQSIIPILRDHFGSLGFLALFIDVIA